MFLRSPVVDLGTTALHFPIACDIAYSTMDQKGLDSLWEDLRAARRSPQTAGDLEALAMRCGREPRTGGKHVVWRTTLFPHRSFPIPRHKGHVPPHVRKVVLNALEADAAAWESLMAEGGNRDGNGGM